MKVSTKALLLVGLVFLVGTVFGGLVGARIALRQLGLLPPPVIENPGGLPVDLGESPLESRPGGRPGPPGGRSSFPGQGRTGQRSQNASLGRMIRQLELDEGQAAQVRKILQESRQKQMAANERQQQLSRKIRKETLEEVKAVLKPEQAERFQRMLQRLNEAQKRGRERRPF